MAKTETTIPKATIERLLNIVLEDTLTAIVSEALAELDHSHQKDGVRKTLADMT